MSFYLVDPNFQSVKVIDEPNYDEYSVILNCSRFAMHSAKINKRRWCFYHDDEGMYALHQNSYVTVLPDGTTIPGKLIICRTDNTGESVGLPVSLVDVKATLTFVKAFK